MIPYTPFAISNFRTGFQEALEPWLSPRDGFQVMKNAHLYRGVIEKIDGYSLYAKMSYRTQMALTGTINGVNLTFTGTLSPVPSTTNFRAQAITNAGATSAEIFTYLSDGTPPVINLQGSAGGTGTVNLTTGAVSITFAVAPVSIIPAATQYNSVIFSWDSAPSPAADIMGIKQYYASNGDQEILIFDTRRVGKIVALQGAEFSTLQTNNGVSEIPHESYQSAVYTGNGATLTFTGTLTVGNIVPGTLSFVEYTPAGVLVKTISDNGTGGITGTNVTSGFINYSTGAYTITYSVAPANLNVINVTSGVYGTVFTGNYTNFFDLVNYQKKAFFTNNIDPPMYYNGTYLQYLNTNQTVKLITGGPIPTYDITRALHLAAERDRLILFSVRINSVDELGAAYWSALFLPNDFTTGGNAAAPTSQKIVVVAVINSDIIVSFSNSEFILRYTGDAFAPFRWDKTNNMWRTDAPYSAINYDSFYTSVGKPAIVASDGVNIKRKDEIIPDFTFASRIPDQFPLISIDQTSMRMCYGERFDDYKEGWLCFRSSNTSPSSEIQRANNVLAFNYMDETYTVYTFPFTCLGFGTVITQRVWSNTFLTWAQSNFTWDSYTDTVNSLVDLAGDQNGNVYVLGASSLQGSFATGNVTGISNANPASVTAVAHGLITGSKVYLTGLGGMTSLINGLVFTITSTGANTFTLDGIDSTNTTAYGTYTTGGTWTLINPVLMDVITKNFNPFIEQGQSALLGYVDLFMSSDVDAKIRVQFFKDDELRLDASGNPTGYYNETTLTLSPTSAANPVSQAKIWKRIYVNCVAKEHTIRIYQNVNDFTDVSLEQPVSIDALVLYFKPAGIIFN